MTLDYGVTAQRVKTFLYENGALIKEKHFAAGYEKEIEGSSTREISYIQAPSGLAATVVRSGGIDSLFYIYTDHQGSILQLNNEAGAIVEQRVYDPWGRERTLSNWSNYLTDAGYRRTDRGYIGQEHLPQFGLINLNARMYDPILGRFLSAYPFVQNPLISQTFNRYSYSMNNPLIYVDENGEFWHIIIGAVVGGAINVAVNWDNIGNFWQGLSYFGVGAASGALTAAFPAAAIYIAGGASAVNSVLQQGYASNWQNVNFSQVAFSGIMGAATSYLGGEIGKGLGVDKWFNGIKSPLLSNVLQSTTTNTIVGGALGGALAELDGDPNTNFWSGAWDGVKMGLVTGTISGIGNAAQYSIDYKKDFLTGRDLKTQTTPTNTTSYHAEQQTVERNVSQSDINDALKKPLKVTEVKYDSQGRPSVEYIGNKVTVVVNPETGNIITVHGTHSKLALKLGGTR